LNGGTGAIAFGTGIAAQDVYLQSNGFGDLTVGIRGDATDSITVSGDLVNQSGTVTSGLQQLQFSDGSVVNLGQGVPITFTWLGTSNASLSGSNYGANIFEFGAGSESATGGNAASGGNGNNTYIASSSTGQATIHANEAAGTTNELDFVGGITSENLWFQQSGNDLKIDLLGTTTQVDVSGWFSNSSNQLQEISAAGLKIDSQISQLVQAMATYSANHTGFDPTARRWRPILRQIPDLIRRRRAFTRFPTMPICRVRWLPPGMRDLARQVIGRAISVDVTPDSKVGRKVD
jgi:hypothetical protein